MTRGAKEIRRVAELALFKVNLPENVAKGSWRNMTRRRLFWLLMVEVWELGWALCALYFLRNRWENAPYYSSERSELFERVLVAKRNAQNEAGDVVAFCAFIVDRG